MSDFFWELFKQIKDGLTMGGYRVKLPFNFSKAAKDENINDCRQNTSSNSPFLGKRSQDLPKMDQRFIEEAILLLNLSSGGYPGIDI